MDLDWTTGMPGPVPVMNSWDCVGWKSAWPSHDGHAYTGIAILQLLQSKFPLTVSRYRYVAMQKIKVVYLGTKMKKIVSTKVHSFYQGTW